MTANTPPNLQALVLRFGTYDKITPEAWAEHVAALAEFRLRMRLGIGRDDQQSEARRMRR